MSKLGGRELFVSAATPPSSPVLICALRFFLKNWLRNLKSEWLVMGNIKQEQTLSLVESVNSLLAKSKRQTAPFVKEDFVEIKAINLQVGKTIVWERPIVETETNSSLVYVFQYDKNSIDNKILIDMSNTFVQEPAFSSLRTQQQLGYIVMTQATDLRGVVGVFFLIQSDVKVDTGFAGQGI